MHATEPYRSTEIRRVWKNTPSASSVWTKRRAARIGPVVCADDGPSPIRNSSNALTNIPRILIRLCGDCSRMFARMNARTPLVSTHRARLWGSFSGPAGRIRQTALMPMACEPVVRYSGLQLRRPSASRQVEALAFGIREHFDDTARADL